ncbi:MAG: ammonium transporter [Candidatus Methanomethylophilaceae archaeon]|nr:ammonium transporter [Candidatus Methanomethylophilaceae archaeon]
MCSAESGDVQDAGDTGWLLICSALVFVMSPGVALFYGGMIRKQSMSSVMAQTVMVMGIMAVSWTVIGYSLAFSGDFSGIIGNLDRLLLSGMDVGDPAGMSETGFALFQMTFSLITASIVLGACMERVRFNAIAVFIAIWSILVYAPMAHWVWGGGLFDQHLVVLDFAGGTVVHICAATTGLALAVFVGRRSDRVIKRAHSMPMVFLGFAMLWFGWLGFNGGSGLAADGIAINAVLVTIVAPAAGLVLWATIQTIHAGHTSTLGLVSGALAGLVAITPAAGYVGPGAALVIGAVGGAVCYGGVIFMRTRSGIDDALDVFGVHGFGAIWGAIATGLLAAPGMVEAGYEGLVYGGVSLFAGQIVAVVLTVLFCFAMSYGIIWAVSRLMRVRLTENEEAVGADMSEHGEPSYMM